MEESAQARPTLTIDEFERLPIDDGYRTELVRGQLIHEPKPAYGHGRLQSRIAYLLEQHIDNHALELECVTEVDFRLPDSFTSVLSPDVALIRRIRIAEDPPRTSIRGAPDLAVEIISPSNTAWDLQAKVADYFAAGTTLVWVVYPHTRSVAVFRSASEARYLTGDDQLAGGDLIPGLRVNLARLFERL